MSVQSELPVTTEQKIAVAATTVAALNKTYGKGTLQKINPSAKAERMPSYASGLPSIDNYVLGIGGLPKGRIVEIYGPESSGKTTITLQFIGAEQKRGGLCAFIDAEHALDPKWAETNGVDTSELLINQPDNGEQALEIALELVKSGAFSIVVVDSVAALVPQAELDGEMGDSHMGLQARLMSQACRKLTAAVSTTGTCLIFINQIRDKIGVMFGSPETTTGGKALKFYAGVRLDIRKVGLIKDGDKIIGNKVKVKGVKNKVAPPFRECEVDLLYDAGFDALGDLIDRAVDAKLLEKSGAWFLFEGNKIQGKPAMREFLSDHGDAQTKLRAQFERSMNAS